MRSKWIEHKGKKIFFQDFSNLESDTEALKQELEQVQAEVISYPKDSLLVLSDFRGTNVTAEIMPILNASSAKTKDYVHKTAVLGVTGIKRVLGDVLTSPTGQKLRYFNIDYTAKDWLVLED